MTTRRAFIELLPLVGVGALAGRVVDAADAPKVSETEPQAVALGYVLDASKADKVKFPKYAPGQKCAICQFYQAAPTAPWAPCTIFGGKQVAANAWCSAYVKRAG
jgi:hypothetical protein